ncbi:MAG TPA: hypothetical protein VNT20_23935 [Flavisolibacter sp.]|jgi:hypothetical protein|nr:hypothetical protein [Flavisolibacter sp.]
MSQPFANHEIKALEKMYLLEIEVLKLKMLRGAFWKDIVKQENKTIELALAIHKKQCRDSISINNFSVEAIL